MTRRVLTLSMSIVLALATTAAAVDADVRRQAKSQNSGDRRKAAKALATEGSVAAVKLLRTLIRDERPYVRDWAVNYCQRLKEPKAIAALVPLTKERDALVGRNGVAALGWTESGTAAVEVRAIATKDKRAEVRREAVAWLSVLPGGEQNVEVLTATCEDADPDVRAESLVTLVKLRPAVAPDLAVARLHDDDEGVRCAALWALSVVAPERVSEHIGAYRPDDGWRVRLQAIETGLVVRDARCIDVLIDLVDHAHRRVTAEAHDALRRATGVDYGKDPELWRSWFAQNRAAWEPPKTLHRRDGAAKDARTTVSYHGVDAASEGVVFVIDKSGSMTDRMTGKHSEWSRWGIALSRLRKTLAETPDGVRVNLVLFSDRVSQAFDRARPLDDAVRKDVETYLKRDAPGGNTNVADTLRAVLAMDDVDTVFFLGDGEPNRGPLVHETRICNDFWTTNRRRKLLVHTVSIGAGDSGRALMRALAKQNRGRCVTY